MSDPDISVDSSIELPAARRGRVKYPLAELKVGQSFFVPAADNTDVAVIRLQGSLHSSIRHVRERTGYCFTTRQWEQDGQRGIRTWRIADGQDGEE